MFTSNSSSERNDTEKERFGKDVRYSIRSHKREQIDRKREGGREKDSK